MVIILIIIWLLIGLITVWRSYHGMRKEWYVHFKKDYRKYNRGDNALNGFLLFSPLFILGGPFTAFLIYMMPISEYNCWYFKYPEDESRDSI